MHTYSMRRPYARDQTLQLRCSSSSHMNNIFQWGFIYLCRGSGVNKTKARCLAKHLKFFSIAFLHLIFAPEFEDHNLNLFESVSSKMPLRIQLSWLGMQPMIAEFSTFFSPARIQISFSLAYIDVALYSGPIANPGKRIECVLTQNYQPLQLIAQDCALL